MTTWTHNLHLVSSSCFFKLPPPGSSTYWSVYQFQELLGTKALSYTALLGTRSTEPCPPHCSFLMWMHCEQNCPQHECHCHQTTSSLAQWEIFACVWWMEKKTLSAYSWGYNTTVVGRGRVRGQACSCAHLNRCVPALTHLFQKMNAKIIFVKRENWSRIRDQSHFDSPLLSLWRLTNFQMNAAARREPAQQITQQIPAKAGYQHSCHWSLLWISPPASQAPSAPPSLTLQPFA